MASRMKRNGEGGERGVALILALMVLVLLTIMAMGALFTATRSTEIAGAGRYNMEAFYVADSGLNRTIADLLKYYAKYNHFGSVMNLDRDAASTNPISCGDCSTCDDYCTAPSDTTRSLAWTGVTAPTLDDWKKLTGVYKINYFSPEQTCFGSYSGGACHGLSNEVWFHPSSESVRVLSLTRDNSNNGNIVAAIEYKVMIVTGSVCDNAIFAGGQATGHAIDGNVEVHGGVTVLCNNITDPSTCQASPPPANCEAVGLSGNSGIFNNYDGGPGSTHGDFYKPLIDTRPTDEAGNETLHAKVMVKTCNASSSGSGTIGTSAAPMDKVCVDGGVTGNTYYTNENHTGPGSFAGCAGSDAPEFPKLKEDSGALTPLGQEIVDLGAGNDLKTADSRWCSLTSSTPSLNFPAGCTCSTNCKMCWDDSTKQLTSYTNEVYDLSGCTGGAEVSGITYDGKATMYYGSNNLKIDGDIMVKSGVSYPSGASMGFMTTGDMNLGDSAQLHIMGVFYAQHQVSVDKQTAIAGILITDYFSVGKNVPEIYQVPDLDHNAPSGFKELCGGNERLAAGGWRLVY